MGIGRTDGKHSGVNARGTATDQATVKDTVFVPVDLQRALAIRSAVGIRRRLESRLNLE